MSDLKQVKVDNWGIFFLQRLKHFFNRTDYCDLTLQFQDNAQLKVHRLVLSACTEYFELLERTCEMYEDCLVMPDDLQADVVVPIVNFMYTGQLEFKMELLERLHQTSLVMNMPVLTKLLDSHRTPHVHRTPLIHSYGNSRRPKTYDAPTPSSSSGPYKRSYTKSFDNANPYMQHPVLQNKTYKKTTSNDIPNMIYPNPDPSLHQTPQKQIYLDPRPTRYELPEELESENLFDNSFTNISYTSKPLMVHPETTKRYPAKRTGIFEDPSTSKRFIHGTQTMDIVECKKISVGDNIFEDDILDSMCDEPTSSNQLFDQILDNGGPKVTIETKDSNQASNLDHAKIISEVLKKYPHLVKSNKNIKLKILNTPSKKKPKPDIIENAKEIKQKSKPEPHSYESEVIDSKEAAKLIALGAENITGPWICLICGAPGKAIHFTSYYNFRRHLVETHNEKPVSHICEYCGQKALKRKFMLHHLYSKHGVEPPPNLKFPKCDICNYIALTEGFLIKHKLTHVENQSFQCNICNATFTKSDQLLRHIQNTGHKYSDKKTTYQCIYCLKIFIRESNLYAHLRISHKESARSDGIIDFSEDEKEEVKNKVIFKPLKREVVKYEVPVTFDNEYDDADIQYQIQQQPDGNIQVVSKKPKILMPAKKHKILNSGLDTSPSKIEEKTKLGVNSPSKHIEILQNPSISMKNQREEIVMIDDTEYIVRNNCLIPKKDKASAHEGYSMPDLMHTDIEDPVQRIIPTSIEFASVQTTNSQEHKMIVNKTGTVNQPIQIVVSNEEEYKALMSSNHSIIFEDGGGGKTLTVLTAPQDNNTTIDLDNSQSNDMMIIPDNYPINVSQAVSGDNSNIVVVYSHAVDDQSKEFQLNLGPQYVTSSGIITQNYETVTTSAPVMNSHIIETPVEDSWQNNLPQNIAPVTELEIPISNNQEVTITPTDNQHNPIENLQEEQMPPNNSLSAEMQSIEEEVINTNIENTICDGNAVHNINKTDVISNSQPDIANSEIQTTFINAVDSVQTSNLNIDCSNPNIPSNDSMDVDQPNEDVNVKNKCAEDSMLLENVLGAQEVETESSPDQQNVDDTQSINTEGSTDAETIENIAREIQSSASITPIEAVHVSVVVEPFNNTEIVSTIAKKQIENLTSEWSDDEIETASQEEQINAQEGTDLKNSIVSQAIETDSQADIEESIENIQHEMQKQLSRPLEVLQSVGPLPEAENETSSSNNDNLLNIEQETEPISEASIKSINTKEENKPPLKISSLLNDWDDNESQEENVPSVNEDKEDMEPIISNDDQNTNNEEAITDTVINKPLINADENIKSLVSDWVEDDEDEEAGNK